jgi:hypothetical protein
MKIHSKNTVITVANATALAAGIIKELSGKEIANTLNGAVVSKAGFEDLIASRIHANFSTFTQKAVK